MITNENTMKIFLNNMNNTKINFDDMLYKHYI